MMAPSRAFDRDKMPSAANLTSVSELLFKLPFMEGEVQRGQMPRDVQVGPS